MQFNRIILENHQQFGQLDLILTYPEGHVKAGKPLEKICLIGKNGTGKTTLLNFLYQFLNSDRFTFQSTKGIIGISNEETSYYFIKLSGAPITNIYHSKIDTELNWLEDFKNNSNAEFNSKYKDFKLSGEEEFAFLEKWRKKNEQLLIFSPSEVHTNELLNTSDLPAGDLNSAMSFFKKFPYQHNVSFQNVRGFWNLIIYQVKKRESDFLEYLYLEDNKKKQFNEIENEFNKKNPFFLIKLSHIWNRILDKAGLYFDVKEAKIPVQLNDNLQAYIKIKATNKNIQYSRLSSGIRHYIFRLGYISSLYFNRPIKSAIALIDEPENSLFPDLLFDLVEQYSRVTRQTQFFYATHSPILASQFEPCERIILDFDDNGNIIYKKGIAAIGDEPNDILLKDFGIQSLLGKEGVKKWERYIELKILIKQEKDEARKETLVKEFLEIGDAYNF